MKIQHKIKSALALALCITPLAQAEESVNKEPIKVLQIVGENHHDYENQKVIIAEGVSKRVNSTWATLHHKTKEAAKEYLDKNPAQRLLLEGHADWRGTAEYNLGLGDRRANAAKKYLLSLGVLADKLEANSKGSLEAKTSADAATMDKDRRVELVIIKAK